MASIPEDIVIVIDLTTSSRPPPTITLPSGWTFTFQVMVAEGSLAPVSILTLQEEVELKMSPVSQLSEKGVTSYFFPCSASLKDPESKKKHSLLYVFTIPESSPAQAHDSGKDQGTARHGYRDQPTSSGKINVSGDLGDGLHAQLTAQGLLAGRR
ncbi:hypothetical protein [Corallococcus llansteffanensis]|nr:hypothetical protein [Corallococcus llansteffanensis]